MSEIEMLLKDIEVLRQNLYDLLKDENSSLTDTEVVTASQILNAALTKYNEIIIRKIKTK